MAAATAVPVVGEATGADGAGMSEGKGVGVACGGDSSWARRERRAAVDTRKGWDGEGVWLHPVEQGEHLK